MSPAGRPPLAGERKLDRMMIRLTEAEREQLDAAAIKAGKPTSTWARDELLRLAAESAKKPARRK
ncbi:MAG: hypothetical protein SH850_08050 [Planctomycetaceae bacterium]|nr:hypothetical protein [Planctomycetaceae bacterium]